VKYASKIGHVNEPLGWKFNQKYKNINDKSQVTIIIGILGASVAQR
jgi:hypothetical protein